jgi:bifunctional DNA-binding transcriptional regulator/antitoxin component of YhaV-PrlF toxin-antitoxin module
MTIELTVTAKGQVTFRRAVLEHLGVQPGGKVSVSLLPDGRVSLSSAEAVHDIRRVKAALRRSRKRPVSLDEMRDAIRSAPK